MKYILFANGSLLPGPAVDAILRQLASDPSIQIIAVDGGANHVYHLKLTPTLIVGDLDSVDPVTLRHYQAHGTEIQVYPPAKDENDLELALLEAVKRDARWIRILAANGDRMDQTIANIYLLALPQLTRVDTHIVAGKQSMWLIYAGEHQLHGNIGDTISLIPLGGDATGIITHHLAYPLHHETLYQGPARGISNVVSGTTPSLSFDSGKLLVIHTIGKA